MALLTMHNIIKEFNGIRALHGVNLTVQEGEVVALCGENGSGKTTLMRILTGVYPYPTYTGAITWMGDVLQSSVIQDSEKKGIAIIHQELSAVKNLSVAENIFLGAEKHHYGILDYAYMAKECTRLLKIVNLDINPETPMGQLSTAHQQLVEIAKAFGKNAKLIIFDEPTSSLAEKEANTLLELIKGLKHQGVSCIYISHKIDEIQVIADKVVVIRDGNDVGIIEKKELNKNAIVSLMVGRPLENLFPKVAVPKGKEILKAEHMKVYDQDKQRYKVDDVSINLYAGEILGMSGLVGSGRTDLALAIYGEHPMGFTGKISVSGIHVPIKNAQDALKAGIALVPEERKKHGIIGIASVLENMALTSLGLFKKILGIDKARQLRVINEYIEKLKVKTPSLSISINSLSGGNQQKIVIAKNLMMHPKVLILDEPTRGVDVGAKYEIYKVMNDLVKEGIGIIMISSELPEILGMSDRVAVMAQGKLKAVLDNKNLSQEDIMKYSI